jgi:hypothetical protein
VREATARTPQAGTVAIEIAYADSATTRTACSKGFLRPKEVYGELAPGEAYVPGGREKAARFIVNLATRELVPAPGGAPDQARH